MGVVLGVVGGVVLGVVLGVVVYGVPPFMWGQPSYEGGAMRACMPDVSQVAVRCGDWAAAEVMRWGGEVSRSCEEEVVM